jgi:hypothetical protein
MFKSLIVFEIVELQGKGGDIFPCVIVVRQPLDIRHPRDPCHRWLASSRVLARVMQPRMARIARM